MKNKLFGVLAISVLALESSDAMFKMSRRNHNCDNANQLRTATITKSKKLPTRAFKPKISPLKDDNDSGVSEDVHILALSPLERERIRNKIDKSEEGNKNKSKQVKNQKGKWKNQHTDADDILVTNQNERMPNKNKLIKNSDSDYDDDSESILKSNAETGNNPNQNKVRKSNTANNQKWSHPNYSNNNNNNDYDDDLSDDNQNNATLRKGQKTINHNNLQENSGIDHLSTLISELRDFAPQASGYSKIVEFLNLAKSLMSSYPDAVLASVHAVGNYLENWLRNQKADKEYCRLRDEEMSKKRDMRQHMKQQNFDLEKKLAEEKRIEKEYSELRWAQIDIKGKTYDKHEVLRKQYRAALEKLRKLGEKSNEDTINTLTETMHRIMNALNNNNSNNQHSHGNDDGQ